jgi:drug/metabolite transporter (DMT)-like permease
MDATLGLVLGSVAALCLGVGDFLARGVTHAVGWKRTLLWLQVASVVPLAGVGWAMTGPVGFGPGDVGRLAALGVVNFVGAVGLYRAFATGALSLVAPVASTFAVVTVGLAALFGDVPDSVVLFGLGCTLVGLGVASFAPGHGGKSATAGMGWALVSSFGFGGAFYMLDGLARDLGAVWPVVGMRLVAIVLTGATLKIWRDPPGARMPWGAVVVVALLDSGGLVAYTAGTLHGHVAVVAVIASCFAVVTIALAQAWLRERLARWQWAGIVLVVAGVAWTTYFSRVG